MKPEVRRALAKEWLILMAVAIAMTLYEVISLYNSEYDVLLSGGSRDGYLREAAIWAVEWSWLVYLALWVPRLTVGSIRLLRTNSNSAKAN